jgi:serine/threonine protein kinase
MSASSLPEAIGPYRILRPIARGGMAEVYEVEDPSNGGHLALKLLVQTGGALARFNREYEAMIRLNHPNIVRVFHYGVEGENPWLTMELVDGTPIQAYAKRCGKPGSKRRNEEVTRLAHDLALALDHIHRHGLLHRDLKSANVLVLPDGRVKLIDFGTARVSQAMEEITKEGEFIGTFAYASPEQLTNRDVDKRSDLYSMGVLLYRLATGKMPFRAKELHALARQHVKDPPKPPRELVPGIPKALEDVILKLLEKKAANRIQSGAKVANALEAVAGHPLFLPQTLDVDLSSDTLVGREDQMADLWRFLDGDVQTASGPADMALVVGLPGSGRNRVMQAIERDAKARKWRALNWFIRRDQSGLDSLIRLLRDVGASLPGTPSPGMVEALDEVQAARGSLGKSASERLEVIRKFGAKIISARATADENPVILLVRGVQNAGAIGFEAMVLLRDQLIQEPGEVRMIADALETADDPKSKARKRLPDVMRVHLAPMSVREVALLVGSLLRRRPPPASVARRIYDASGGLPAYVEEVIKGLIAQGILRVQGRDSNRIEWAKNDDQLEIPVPEGARQRVMDQLAELPADRRRVLEVLALAGGDGSVSVLAAALQCRAVELTPALDDLEHRGWIKVDRERGAPYVSWRQRLAEHVVLAQMRPCRRRVMQRLLIDQVAEEPAFAAQIRLLIDVGRHPEALERALDWAAHHIGQNNPVTALEVLDLVMPTVMEVPVSTHLKATLYLLHVSCLLMARPTDPGTSVSLQRATRLGQVEGAGFQAELHLLRARIQRVIGHYPNFRKHLMEAWRLVEQDASSAVGSHVAGLLGWSNEVAGHVDDAATWHGRARRIAVQTGIQEVRAHADVGVAGWQLARGFLLDSERTAQTAIYIFDNAGDSRGLSMAIPVWAHSLRLQGRLSEALKVLYKVVAEMRESEAPSFYVRLLLAKAWCEVDLCRLGIAQECVDELAATLRRGEHLDLRLEADLVWGRILLASDQVEDAHRVLVAVRDRSSAAGLRVIAATATALIGEVLMRLDDEPAARETFRVAIDQLRITGDIPATVGACEAHGRAMGHLVETSVIFEPVAAVAERHPYVMLNLAMTLARARFAKQQGVSSDALYGEATERLQQLSLQLADTDKAAMRLHPWSREARLA